MRTKTPTLVRVAILVALAMALSFAKLYEFPMGGALTFGSMLPIMLIALSMGHKWGLAGAFIYSLFQLVQALIEGNVFPYCETWQTLVLCVLFDYLVPFTVLGLAGIFRNFKIGKFRHAGAYLGITCVCVARFACHYITGVAIWGQWAPDGMGKYLYSLLYNGGYMLPELGLTIVLAALLLESPEIRRLINLPVDRDLSAE